MDESPAYELVMLDKNYSSWSMRPWLVLTHLGVPFRETILHGHASDTPARIAEASPTAKLPVLRHEGRTVWESIAILEYLAELHPDRGLWPRDAGRRAEARAYAAEMHAGFGELRRNCAMNVVLRTARVIDAATQRDVDRLDAIFRTCRARYAGDGPFLMGEFGIVDAMFAPVATRFRSYGITVSPESQAYLETLLAQPAVARFCAEAETEAERVPGFTALGRESPKPPREIVPDAPRFAVIFANQLSDDADDYGEVGARMQEEAKRSPGYVDYVSTRSADGFGITVSYWSSLDAIATWRAHVEHAAAQRTGRARYYTSYSVEVARVERGHRFTRTTRT